MTAKKLLGKFLDLFAEEDPADEPFYDPVHLGGAIILSLAGIGILFWLLWTLLVYEGGLFSKAGPALEVLFTSKTLKDFGYEGSPYALGLFEGWLGNLIALILCSVLVAALHRLYWDAARKKNR